MKKSLAIIFILLAFKPKEKPIMIQDWKLDQVKMNDKGQAIFVHFKKTGEPHELSDTNLISTVHTILP